MRTNNFDEIVNKTTAYIKKNITSALGVEDIAKAMCYSSSHLRRAFREVTGEGLLPSVIALRVEHAKELLQKTDLNLSEVAENSGFSDYLSFYRAFKQKAKMTPSQFSNTSRKMKEAPGSISNVKTSGTERIWFQDTPAENLQPWWKILKGDWGREKENIKCEGNADVLAGLERSLPENFKLSFSFQFPESKVCTPNDMIASLWNEDFSIPYCEFVIGTIENTTGELRRFGVATQWNPAGLIKPGAWQQLVLELQDDRVSCMLDNCELFSLQEPFSPSYTNRCKVVFGTWRSSFRFKDLKITDTGFSPLVKNIKQGDSLYNATLYAKAADFYLRCLEASSSEEEIAELRYKIGMCNMKQEMLSQSRGWFEKVLTGPAGGFWRRYAQIGELEILVKERSYDEFKSKTRALFSDLLIKNEIRQIVIKTAEDLRRRGFVLEALGFDILLYELEEKNTWPYLLALWRLEEGSLKVGNFKESEGCILSALKNTGTPRYFTGLLKKSLSYIHAVQGEFDASDALLAEMEKGDSNPDSLVYCAMNRSFNMRGRGKLKRALELLNKIHEQHTESYDDSMAGLESGVLLCMLGNYEEARLQFQKIVRHSWVDERKPFFEYVLLLMEKDYEKAASIFIEGFRKGYTAIHAAMFIIAGILLELAAKKPKEKLEQDPESFPRYVNITDMLLLEARKIWAEGIRRFPLSQINFYAELAQCFLSNSPDNLEKLPGLPLQRSEMFYLAGLFYESRGNEKRAKELLNLSIKEDATLNWPAYLSKERLRNKVEG